MKPTTSDKQVDVVVVETDTGVNSTLTQKLTYDFTNTPTVTSVTPNILSVLGKKLINGSKLIFF